MAMGIVWIWGIEKWLRPYWNLMASPLGVYRWILWLERFLYKLVCLTNLALGIFAIVMVCIDDPYLRSCTQDNFPVHFKLHSWRRNVRGIINVETGAGEKIWKMAHYPLKSNMDIYSMNLLMTTTDENSIFNNVTWPQSTGVRSMIYDLSQPEKGKLSGFCGPKEHLCLNGTVEMDPLRLEWTYTDPITKIREEKVLESEGTWQFGRRHRPWVNLHENDLAGDIVFRAPSSKIVCGAGDGDLRNAVVPVGLIMIAEQKYQGRY
jgi:hypothetical protein